MVPLAFAWDLVSSGSGLSCRSTKESRSGKCIISRSKNPLTNEHIRSLEELSRFTPWNFDFGVKFSFPQRYGIK